MSDFEHEHKEPGGKLIIRTCHGADVSLKEAFGKMPSQKHQAAVESFVARRKLLALNRRLRSPDQFNTEAELPDGSKFYAIKTTQGLRAYGWFSKKHKNCFYISHFVYKNYKKLKASDTTKVNNNWNIVEGG